MNAKPKVQLKSRILPFITAVLVIMQFIDSSRVWMMLLVGLGGAWLVSYFWARSLANNLQFEREMRFGWA